MMVAVYGDAGHGKTTLLRDLAVGAASEGALVVSLSGGTPDREIPYAGVHSMLTSNFNLLGAGETPAERFLRTVVTEYSPPESPLAMCSAVTAWLECLAPAAPVLICVDDADHVDEESLRVLAFAASREQQARVAVVFTATARVDLLDRVQVTAFELDDLDDQSARCVLADRNLGVALIDQVIDRLGGNPLALNHAATVLADDATGLGDEGPVPLHTRLTAHVEERLSKIDLPAQQVLEAAAICSEDRLSALSAWCQATGLGDVDRLVLQAEDAGLVTFDDRTVSWRRPWMAEGVVHLCSTGRRQRLRAQLMEPRRHSPPLARAVARAAAPVAVGVLDLTAAEQRVAELIAGGAGTRTAAEVLCLSEKTIDSHLQHIYRKLDVHSRAQLVAYVLERRHAGP